MKSRPVTLASSSWADLSLEEFCTIAAQMGYDGVELACGVHLDPVRASGDEEYTAYIRDTVRSHALRVFSLDIRVLLDSFAREVKCSPLCPAGSPESLFGQLWSVPDAARRLEAGIVTAMWPGPLPLSSEPPDGPRLRHARDILRGLFDAEHWAHTRMAFDLEPGCVAFDYYTALDFAEQLGDVLSMNFDPAPLEWQGISPVVFVRDFAPYIGHVRIRDVAVRLDGRSGILGSRFTPGDTRRGWNYRGPGHGDVDFEGVMRELDAGGYKGPLCVQWDDPGMERVRGATEACEFLRQLELG